MRFLGRGQCTVRRSTTFQPEMIPATEVVALLVNALAANCLALKQLLEHSLRQGLGYAGPVVLLSAAIPASSPYCILL